MSAATRRLFVSAAFIAFTVAPRAGWGQAASKPGDPLPGLTDAETSRFAAGKAQFENVEEVADGLGPVFNANACSVCHAGPATGGSSKTLATRIGVNTRKGFDPLLSLGGPTIQVAGIGQVPGADFLAEVVPKQAKIVAHRRSNPTFGLGLVDAVPDETFFGLAVEQWMTQPSTAGRPNIVQSIRTGQPVVGRFGWKAQAASLYEFAADAYKDELGITTAGFTRPGQVDAQGQPIVFPFHRSDDGRLVSEENPPQGNAAILKFDPKASPNESDDGDLIRLADFMTMLAPPSPSALSARGVSGQRLFVQIGCATCHVPSLTTGPSPIAALHEVTFSPYSDFLLHDMGSLGDGIGAATATGREMRTAPLWGLSQLPFFLHDGRAATIDQAIRLHDGQGRPSARKYAGLSASQRAAILEFLKSL